MWISINPLRKYMSKRPPEDFAHAQLEWLFSIHHSTHFNSCSAQNTVKVNGSFYGLSAFSCEEITRYRICLLTWRTTRETLEVWCQIGELLRHCSNISVRTTDWWFTRVHRGLITVDQMLHWTPRKRHHSFAVHTRYIILQAQSCTYYMYMYRS